MDEYKIAKYEKKLEIAKATGNSEKMEIYIKKLEQYGGKTIGDTVDYLQIKLNDVVTQKTKEDAKEILRNKEEDLKILIREFTCMKYRFDNAVTMFSNNKNIGELLKPGDAFQCSSPKLDKMREKEYLKIINEYKKEINAEIEKKLDDEIHKKTDTSDEKDKITTLVKEMETAMSVIKGIQSKKGWSRNVKKINEALKAGTELAKYFNELKMSDIFYNVYFSVLLESQKEPQKEQQKEQQKINMEHLLELLEKHEENKDLNEEKNNIAKNIKEYLQKLKSYKTKTRRVANSVIKTVKLTDTREKFGDMKNSLLGRKQGLEERKDVKEESEESQESKKKKIDNLKSEIETGLKEFESLHEKEVKKVAKKVIILKNIDAYLDNLGEPKQQE
jgi:hypothetical protein